MGKRTSNQEIINGFYLYYYYYYNNYFFFKRNIFERNVKIEKNYITNTPVEKSV